MSVHLLYLATVSVIPAVYSFRLLDIISFSSSSFLLLGRNFSFSLFFCCWYSKNGMKKKYSRAEKKEIILYAKSCKKTSTEERINCPSKSPTWSTFYFVCNLSDPSKNGSLNHYEFFIHIIRPFLGVFFALCWLSAVFITVWLFNV